MVDARIPESSRNPIIEEIKGQKKQLILIKQWIWQIHLKQNVEMII